jgi:cation transport ATPase
MGVSAAFTWSVGALFLGDAGQPGLRHHFTVTLDASAGSGHIYLEVAAGVPLFILAGRYMEGRARLQLPRREQQPWAQPPPVKLRTCRSGHVVTSLSVAVEGCVSRAER